MKLIIMTPLIQLEIMKCWVNLRISVYIAVASNQDVKEEIIQDVKEEIIQDVKEEIIQDVKEEIIQDVKKEIIQDVKTECFPQDNNVFTCDVCQEVFSEEVVLFMHKDLNHSWMYT